MLSILKNPKQYTQLFPTIFYLLCCAFRLYLPPLANNNGYG